MRSVLWSLLAAAAAFGQPASSGNRSLPAWLKASVELRGRAEAHRGIAYTPGNNDGYYLHRLRLNVAVEPDRRLRFVFQVQDAQAPGLSRKPAPAGMVNTLDLRQGYLELGPADAGPLSLRVGRQDLIFGEERLIGAAGWGNVGRSFDAVRLTWRRPGMRLDGFASAVVPVLNGRFDRPRLSNGFYGLYGSLDKLLRDGVIEPFLLWKTASHTTAESGRSGDLDLYTGGARVVSKLPRRLDCNVEMALQGGRAAGDRVRAWAGHWALGWTPWKDRPLRLIAEYNFASGDRDPRDGRRGTFDQLYPTNHSKYGTADQIGWRNIHDLMPGLEWRPRRKWRLKFDYHAFWLADRRDALYTEAGAVFARNPQAAGSRIGWELDAQADWQFSDRLQLGLGYARLFAGPYLKQTTPGSGFSYPYLTWSYRF